MSRKRSDHYEQQMHKAMHEILYNLIYLKTYRSKHALRSSTSAEEDDEEEDHRTWNQDCDENGHESNNARSGFQWDEGQFEQTAKERKCPSKNVFSGVEKQSDITVSDTIYHNHPTTGSIMNSSEVKGKQNEFDKTVKENLHSFDCHALSNSKCQRIRRCTFTEKRHLGVKVQERSSMPSQKIQKELTESQSLNEVSSVAEVKVQVAQLYKRRLLPSIPRTRCVSST